MANYKISNRGMAQLLGLEGIALTKYYDSVGVQTIGGGATASDIPDLKKWSWDRELSLDDCVALFRKHIIKYEAAVNRALNVEIEQHQFDALVSICYNIGINGMARSTFMRRINSGYPLTSIRNARSTVMKRFNARYPLKSIYEAILMWDIPKEIIGRRRKEADLYISGTYSEKGLVNVFPISKTSHKPIYGRGKSINMLEYLNKGIEEEKIEEVVKEIEPLTSSTFWDTLKKWFWKI